MNRALVTIGTLEKDLTKSDLSNCKRFQPWKEIRSDIIRGWEPGDVYSPGFSSCIEDFSSGRGPTRKSIFFSIQFWYSFMLTRSLQIRHGQYEKNVVQPIRVIIVSCNP